MRENLARRFYFERNYIMSKNYNVTFVDKSDEVKKTIVGLSKTALRASGKVIRKHLRDNIPLRSKRFKNHIGTWVMINYATGQPTLQVGFYSWQRVKKKGKLPSHASPHWIEKGVKPHIMPGKKNNWQPGRFMSYDNMIFGYKVNHPGSRATNVLRNTVHDNIQEIRAAQEEYLKAITGELEAAGFKVDKGNEFEDDD